MHNVIAVNFPRKATKEDQRAFDLCESLKRTCQRSPLETLAGERRIYSEDDLETNVKLERMKAISYLEEVLKALDRQYMTRKQIKELIQDLQKEIAIWL